jgi:hypothetical protein
VFAVQNWFRVLLGMGLTLACASIFSYGLSHATLDQRPFVFPTFQGGNLLFFSAAPIAQCTFYILARKTSWLLNIYLAISLLCCFVAWLHLTTDGGYRFTYWHQGDYNCKHGCDDAWIFGYLVLLQGCILLFASSAFEGFSGSWQAVLRLILVFVLLLLFMTSCTIAITM